MLTFLSDALLKCNKLKSFLDQSLISGKIIINKHNKETKQFLHESFFNKNIAIYKSNKSSLSQQNYKFYFSTLLY